MSSMSLSLYYLVGIELPFTRIGELQMITDAKMKSGFIQALAVIEMELGSDCPISLLNILMRVPRTGEISISELRKQTKMTGGGMSRLIAILAGIKKEGRRSIKPFINLRDDPVDRRYSLISLTEDGKNFVDRVVSQLSFYVKQEV